MSSFPTSGPIAVSVEANYALVQVRAADAAEASVDVQPTDPGDPSHVEVAAGTRVDLLGNRLQVMAPKPSLLARIRNSPSVDIMITAPAGSALTVSLAAGNVEAVGTIGPGTVHTGAGNVRLGDTGSLDARTGSGDVVVGHVTGDVTIETGSGHVQLGSATGNVSLKTGSSGPRLGAVGGNLLVRAGHGRVEVESAAGDVDARTTHGAVVIGLATGSDVDIKTAHGDLELGVPDGRAVWLDLDTKYGRVTSDFTPGADAPAASDGPAVRVLGRTSYGDIRIHRVPAGS